MLLPFHPFNPSPLPPCPMHPFPFQWFSVAPIISHRRLTTSYFPSFFQNSKTKLGFVLLCFDELFSSFKNYLINSNIISEIQLTIKFENLTWKAIYCYPINYPLKTTWNLVHSFHFWLSCFRQTQPQRTINWFLKSVLYTKMFNNVELTITTRTTKWFVITHLFATPKISRLDISNMLLANYHWILFSKLFFGLHNFKNQTVYSLKLFLFVFTF